MKQIKLFLGILSLSISLSSCSYQWMESDSGASSSEVMGLLNEILGSSTLGAANSAALQEFINIKNNPNSSIYFAFAPGTMGPVASISSLVRYHFLGAAGSDIYYDTIEEVKVFYAYLPAYAGNKGALLIDLKVKGHSDYITKTFVTVFPPQIVGSEYVAILGEAGQEKLVLRSYNIHDGELERVIQFRVSDFDSLTGLETENGKFSVLEGFGP